MIGTVSRRISAPGRPATTKRRSVGRRCTLLLLLVAGVVAPQRVAAKGTHGIAIHDDLKYGPDFKHFEYVNPAAPKGGELRLAVIGSFDSLNPFIVRGDAAARIGLIFDTLLTASADEPASEYGLLAESIEVAADRSSVTFTLCAQARFHDGKPVTVEDVIWSFESLRDKGHPHYRSYYQGVEKVEKSGERQVKFTFKPGVNRELPLILGQFAVLPRHDWVQRKFEETTLEPLLGSGPYRIARFEPGRYIEYRRVADYWGKDLPVNTGRYNFDVLRFDYYRDDAVAIEALKGGAYDVRLESSSKDWATAYNVPAVREGRLVRKEFPHRRPVGMQGFAFNLRRPLFQDRRVREAVGYAFDFEWSNKQLFYGQYTRSRSYFETSELAAIGLPGPAELAVLEPYRGRIPDEVFTKEYQPPKTDGSGNNRDNLRRAAELLKQSGWEVERKTKKLTHRVTGQVMEFEILINMPLFERVLLPFAKNLERLGVTARVRSVDPAQYERRVEDFDFDMVVANFPQSFSPGNEQRSFWSSQFANQPGSPNILGLNDPVIDALVEQLIAAPDRATLIVRTRALDRVLQWGHYVIPNWHISYDRVLYWNKFGIPAVIPDMGVQIEDTWWFDPTKAVAPTLQ